MERQPKVLDNKQLKHYWIRICQNMKKERDDTKEIKTINQYNICSFVSSILLFMSY